MAKLTPMLQQYWDIKRQHQDALVFFRLGDFYEMFGEDAKESSKILGITLTARYKGKPNEIPMCGVPYHAVENYIVKLTRAYKKVAICEQVTPPDSAGIVKRQVSRIITPGTTLNSNVLEDKSNNYLIALTEQKNNYGLAVADVGTGELQTNETPDSSTLQAILARLEPREIITLKETAPRIKILLNNLKNTVLHIHQPPFNFNAYQELLDHFKVNNLHSFGLENLSQAQTATGLALDYLKQTQKTDLSHINSLKLYHYQKYLYLDQTTIRNLELLANLYDGSPQGSLLQIIDQTKTAMGGRLLKNWLRHPLLSAKHINQRLEAVEYIQNNLDFKQIQKLLIEITDIERILGKIGLERANARDLSSLQSSLEKAKELKRLLPLNIICPLIKKNAVFLDEHKKIIELLEKSITDEPPSEITQGRIIKEGYNPQLDELRKISREGKDYLQNITRQEIKRTGIQSLKIKYNQIFGYYIEISKAKLAHVPTDYLRKQTLVNAERFITPELKEFEEKILTAEEKIKTLEYDLFVEIRDQVVQRIPTIQKTARAVATLDVLTSFATLARENNYVKPQINESGKIFIQQGRHPVIEKILSNKPYIPNDVYLDQKSQQVILLTGPNMSGKSSYLRQVALITLLAQVGCFVPAQRADLAIVDRIFTRVGASDNVAHGQSTFMVEMQETANILHNATPKSLIILDELGRGTSTYDGLSIAWAVLEYIHHQIGAKTVFATHYHELIDIAEKLPRAKNYSIAVTEHHGEVVFLYQVRPGGTSDSYGIEVAKLAGLPPVIISRSQEILTSLEDSHTGQLRLLGPTLLNKSPKKEQTSPQEQALLKTVRCLNPDQITPLKALQILTKMVKKIKTNI